MNINQKQREKWGRQQCCPHHKGKVRQPMSDAETEMQTLPQLPASSAGHHNSSVNTYWLPKPGSEVLG